MLTRDGVREIENAYAFRYPESFLARLAEIVSVIDSERFCDNFSGATLLASVSEIQAACKDIPDCLQPFMIVNDVQATSDIYAFERTNNWQEPRIVVWCDHAIVRYWDGFPEFWRWVQGLIQNNPKAGPIR